MIGPLRQVALRFVLLLTIAGCGHDANPEPKRLLANTGEGPGVTLLSALPSEQPIAGQTVYVPIYAYIPIDDNAKPFNLAATLYIRNTDQARPIVVASVNYYGASGTLIRKVLQSPIQLAPLASTSFFIKESESDAGSSTSFLVQWIANDLPSPPIIESVMVGTLMNQGVTFRSEGLVVQGRPEGEKK